MKQQLINNRGDLDFKRLKMKLCELCSNMTGLHCRAADGEVFMTLYRLFLPDELPGDADSQGMVNRYINNRVYRKKTLTLKRAGKYSGMPEIPLRAERAGNPLYKSCQMQSLHETSAPNDSGDKRGDTTENEAKGKCREA